MHALVHRESCIQCGLCPSLCPEVFTLANGESAMVTCDPIPEACRAAVQQATDSCPVSAIHIS